MISDLILVVIGIKVSPCKSPPPLHYIAAPLRQGHGLAVRELAACLQATMLAVCRQLSSQAVC